METLKVIIKDVGGIETIRSMGIGAPNGNYHKGTIEYAPNLPWAHFPKKPSIRVQTVDMSNDRQLTLF